MVTENETYVDGQTRRHAAALLDAATALGMPADVVRTVVGGFEVPTVVAVQAGLAPKDTDEPPKSTEKTAPKKARSVKGKE